MMSYSQVPEDDHHYTIIGRVACRWATLEALIDGVIADLAQCGAEEMTCVTAQLIGPAKRMDALIALFTPRKGSDGLRKQLKAFQGRIQQLGEDRNKVVHDPLLLNEETGQVHKLLATREGRAEVQPCAYFQGPDGCRCPLNSRSWARLQEVDRVY
jgi:hypothetical protein